LDNWHVYMILCSDDTLYTGISTDVERRFLEHKNLRGAKYFRGRQPVKIVYLESAHSRSSASKTEAKIKNFTRKKKLLLLESTANETI